MPVPKVSVLERVDCILKFIVNTPLNIHVNVSDVGYGAPFVSKLIFSLVINFNLFLFGIMDLSA